jgi:hypothetical protein
VDTKRWLAAPLLAAALAACGGGDGGSTAEWCDVAEEVESSSNALDALDPTDPESVRTTFSTFRDLVSDAVDKAPGEIKDDVETTKKALDKMYAELEGADFNILDVDLSVFEELGTEVEAAGDRIQAFNEKECGITPDTSDGATDTTAASDGTDTTAEGDDGSSGSDDTSGTVRDQMAQQFEAMGLTAEQARCLADAIDPADFAGSDPDMSLLFELFDQCGVSAEDLAEIGANQGG